MNAFTSYIKAINAMTAIDFSNIFSNAFSVDNTNSVSTIKPDNTLIENEELKALSGIQFVDILRDSNFINDDSIDGYKIKNIGTYDQFTTQLGKIDQSTLSEQEIIVLNNCIKNFTTDALKLFYSKVIDRTSVIKYPIKFEKTTDWVKYNNGYVRPFVEKYVPNEQLLSKIAKGDKILCYEVPTNKWMKVTSGYNFPKVFGNVVSEEDLYRLFNTGETDFKKTIVAKLFNSIKAYGISEIAEPYDKKPIGAELLLDDFEEETYKAYVAFREKYYNSFKQDSELCGLSKDDATDLCNEYHIINKEIVERNSMNGIFDFVHVPLGKMYYARKDDSYRLFTILKLYNFCQDLLVPILELSEYPDEVLELTRNFVDEITFMDFEFDEYIEDINFINNFEKNMIGSLKPAKQHFGNDSEVLIKCFENFSKVDQYISLERSALQWQNEIDTSYKYKEFRRMDTLLAKFDICERKCRIASGITAGESVAYRRNFVGFKKEIENLTSEYLDELKRIQQEDEVIYSDKIKSFDYSDLFGDSDCVSSIKFISWRLKQIVTYLVIYNGINYITELLNPEMKNVEQDAYEIEELEVTKLRAIKHTAELEEERQRAIRHTAELEEERQRALRHTAELEEERQRIAAENERINRERESNRQFYEMCMQDHEADERERERNTQFINSLFG